MQQNIPVQQIMFNRPLVELRIQASDHFYLSDAQAKTFQPATDVQSHSVSEALNPILQEQIRKQEDQVLESLLEQLLANVQTIDQRREQALQEMQQVAIELAVAAASHLVQTVIEEDKFGIEELVRSVFERVGEDTVLSFTLHPDDLALLNRRLSVTTSYQEISNFNYSANDTLARGSCQVNFPDGQNWLIGISQRLAEIRKHWLEELDAAQIERRKTETTNSSLRRFPDRRETA